MRSRLASLTVQELLRKSGRRIELLLRFSDEESYQLCEWNRGAAELFDLPPMSPDRNVLSWEELSPPLVEYFAEALPLISGAPEEALPAYQSGKPHHPPYFVKLFYNWVPAGEGQPLEHWYLFCFQDINISQENSQSALDRQKLETIGELASGVAHDFNNLLMGIHANAESMMSHRNLAESTRESVANIIRACANGASLTRSLLGYAKKQPLTMTTFNLIDLVGDVTRLAGLASGVHRLALGPDFQTTSSPILVSGSFASLSHCLLNLIKNAREAMPDGGTIHVLWEGDAERSCVTVRDHGPGISEADLAHLFEPFFSTKKLGTGLGLAMVRGLLQQHSGTVEIRSTLGMGTAVSLVWPRGLVSTFETVPDPRRSTKQIFRHSQRIILHSQRQPEQKHYTVWVIDDDDLVRDGICTLLQHLCHRTVAFADATIALSRLLQAQPAPDIVIVDYNMPGLTGTDFITRYSQAAAVKNRSEAKILLMSGLPPSQFHEFMLQHEHLKLGILEKPFSLETLRRKLLQLFSPRPYDGFSSAADVAPSLALALPQAK